ncbi:mitochondrial-processing peptidase subunit alpha-like [Tubulanus polymorphus]|uniref:mitochondrial-processing peptidase subunit alpha-like n=1 Tax=Tubulanus polymorphus TaxID=672921 RepID=UPI003DA61212
MANRLRFAGNYINSHHRLFRRCCSSISDITRIPLSKSIPHIIPYQYATTNRSRYETKVTTLNNGIRVASENTYGNFMTVGVALDSGPRYGLPFPAGIQHFFEKLAFSSTAQYENRDVILQELEKYGGISDCQGTRDTLLYAVSAERKGLASMVNLLSEVILTPKITEDELQMTRAAIGFELESMDMQPDPEPILLEMIHAAAYKGNSLGLPSFSPKESLPLINRETLLTYLNVYHRPERMVIAGVGMEHEHLVDLAQKYFEPKIPTWVSEGNLVDQTVQPDYSIAQYTGGILKVEKDLSNVSLGPTPMPELAHLVIGLESCSHKDPDFVPYCVLNMMMGGGGSFSAGGPGKGMFSRLYINVLNRHEWIYSARAYNHAYNDGGIFCIHASSHPSNLKQLSDVILKEFTDMLQAVPEMELSRSKRQLQSMLLMNLESRPVVFEDIARQVLSNGVRQTDQFYFDEIEKVTDEDIHRVAARMLKTKLTAAALGNLNQLPKYSTLQETLINSETRKSKMFSIF